MDALICANIGVRSGGPCGELSGTTLTNVDRLIHVLPDALAAPR
jgi:hypothetical protein